MIKRIRKCYVHMKDRCYNPKDKRYERYGGRGITICDEWLNDYSAFENWALSNGYSDDLTIDRIDNDGNYEPNNCRFVTVKENNNNRSSNKRFTYNGKTQTLVKWCEEYNMNYGTVICRLRAGWGFPKALLTQPIKRDRTSLIGKRFGRLIVQAYAGDEYIGSDNNSRWICKCDCGNTTIVGQNKLKSGHTQSCGCLQKQRASEYQHKKASKNHFPSNDG